MKKIMVIIALLVCSLVMPIYAQDEEINLDKIVVTPTRSNEYIKNAPNNVTIISRKDIEKSTSKIIPDIIREKAGVVVKEYSSGNGKLADVDIRGFGESGLSNTLVLVDGRRVTQIDLSGTDWTQIPLDVVERIEIIRGAASVFYGDNASGGVINIITRDGKGKPGIKVKSEMGSYASYDNKIESSGEIKNFNYYSFARYYESAGYRNNNDIKAKDFGLKFGYKLSDTLNAKLSLGFHGDTYGLPGALNDDQINSRGRRATIYPIDDGESNDSFGNLMIENDFAGWGKFATDVSMRTRQVKTDNYDNFTLTDSYIKTFGFTPKYMLNNSILNRNNKITVGFDYYDAQDHINSGPPNDENDVTIISKRSFGIYFFDQLSVIDKLKWSFGYRHEHARYNFEQLTAVASQRSEEKKEQEKVLTSGLNYIYDKNDSNLYLNYSESFRFPLVDEFYSSASPNWGGGLNTNINTQRGKNYELGIRHYFTKDIYSNFTLFRMDLKNEIYLEPVSYKNLNYDRTRREGIEWESKARLWDKINLFANYTFTDARFYKGDFGGNQIPAVPIHKWAAGFDIDLLKELNLSLITNYVGERYFLSDQRNKFPRMAAYTTVDLRLSYNKNNFSIYGGIRNLFNEEYYEYGVVSGSADRKNYYPAPERNFILGGFLKF